MKSHKHEFVLMGGYWFEQNWDKRVWIDDWLCHCGAFKRSERFKLNEKA